MSSAIKTPDQRLRVFVSSTLGELAAERAAVRRAIERLRLIPVMFELGARPHPPRELYRAYLEQSHVFIGVYWQRYGWIAPGEAVSGLEDEYRLAGDRPRLLYLKEPADEREEALADLIADLQADDRASYKRFTGLDELEELVEDDLALLLSERFAAGDSHGGDPAVARPVVELPTPLTEIVGREEDAARVVDALRGGARLVTLTGAGGIGKTRLAVEVGHRVAPDRGDGVVFVPLASFTEVPRALHAVVDALGTRSESGSALDALSAHLRDRHVLLVLDNTEQIEGFGAAVAELLERTPGPQVLVTSRHALRVRGEVEVPVRALGEEAARALFLDRARAATHGPESAEPDVERATQIVRRLDGHPLAIELAATRLGVLSTGALLDRLGASLDVLSAPGGDRPARQRTLRATLDWSHDLLNGPERTLFARLGVFANGWTLDAAEAVAAPPEGLDVVEGLASLLDKSLVMADHQSNGEPRFRMLEPVRVYAAEQLARTGEAADLAARHHAWYRRLADEAKPHLCGLGQREWVDRIGAERANVEQAVATALAEGDDDAAVELAWDLAVFYFVVDAVDQPDGWLGRVRAEGRALGTVTEAKLRSLHALTRAHHGDYRDVHRELLEPLAVFRAEGMDFETAVALHQLGFVRFHLDDDAGAAIAALRESSVLFDRVGHDWGVSLAEAMLGSVLAATGDLASAEASQQRALERGRRIESDQQVAQALVQLAIVRLLDGRAEEARGTLAEAVPILVRGAYRTDAANALDALAVIAADRGSGAVAAAALAGADAERERLGVHPWPTVARFRERARPEPTGAQRERPLEDREADASAPNVFAVLETTLAALGGVR